MIVLVILSSFAGAVGVVGGLMLLFGSLNTADFAQGAFADAVEDSWGWYLLLLVLAFVGIIVQARQAARAAADHQRDLVRREPVTSAAGSAGGP